MLILFFKYSIIYYIRINLIYIRFVLIQTSKLLFNYCLLFFENLFFNIKSFSKKYTFRLILNNTKSILTYS